MPEKLKRIFEKEYGKSKGDRIFYGYENKHGFHYPKKEAELVLKGSKSYIHRMRNHLLEEHPTTRGHLFVKSERRSKYV